MGGGKRGCKGEKGGGLGGRRKTELGEERRDRGEERMGVGGGG